MLECLGFLSEEWEYKPVRELARRLSMVFAAGALGGLTDSLAVWCFGAYGISAALGVNLAPALTPGWLYQRLIWAGIWGALFLLPILPGRVVLRGVLLSLGPTLVQLFIVFPFKVKKGMLGLELGTLTPALVFIFNVIWGITTALWLKYVSKVR